MTVFKLGYVAMSVNLQNCSPSQTITYKRFTEFNDFEAGINKLEAVAKKNIQNCLRLLIHNRANDIQFFRLSSRLVPLATHERLKEWNYIKAIQDDLVQLGEFATQNNMRVDFHPDHFVVLNARDKEVFKFSIVTLDYHYKLLRHMKLDTTHRAVLHLGGRYEDKVLSLERFISNWSLVPHRIQNMIILENDDKTYDVDDILYVSEKLNVPFVFDYHHHLANQSKSIWSEVWQRILETWRFSPHPIKMHISSPKSEKQYRAHADFVDSDMFLAFAKEVNGSTNEIHCMIEAKQKDEALFKLMNDLRKNSDVEIIDGASFSLKQ